MELSTFEKELKTIDQKLRIVPHPQNKDIAGVYWDTIYTGCAIPSGDIFDQKNEGYQDAYGFPHKTRPEAVAQVKHFLWRMQNEADFMETMTQPL